MSPRDDEKGKGAQEAAERVARPIQSVEVLARLIYTQGFSEGGLVLILKGQFESRERAAELRGAVEALERLLTMTTTFTSAVGVRGIAREEIARLKKEQG